MAENKTLNDLGDGAVKSEEREAVLALLTTEEKAALTSGKSFWQTESVERLGIKPVTMSDGPHGLRKQEAKGDHLGLMGSIPATSFPTAATLANSWDDQLLYEVGEAIASEAIEQSVDVILGPGLNIKRNPLSGRNFEYFSEDALLSGKLAAAFIRGAQSVGVAACPKHFAVNSQETNRMKVDEVVDERALHEIYLEGFRIAVEEGSPWMMMSSYNQVNGEYSHQNPYLISDVLRGRWGYDGVVVSDWGGNVDSAAALAAGSNLEMPGSGGVGQRRVLKALEEGDLVEADLDARVREFLTLTERIQGSSKTRAPLDPARQHEIARQAAEESLVLLRNEDDALPLAEGERVAVIGQFADVPRYQGAGSSLVNPTKIVSALDALSQSDLRIVGHEPGFKRADKPSKSMARKALSLSATADTVLLFLGLDEGAESEGVDRQHMNLARNQLALTRDLVNQSRHLGTKIIVVLAGGAPVELPFADHVEGLLHTYLGGQAGGEATVRILTGQVNPSGKLAESYALKYEDVASSAGFTRDDASAEHRESIYVGYRHYDKAGIEVRYPFGFGLSYTDFEYSGAKVLVDEASGLPTKLEVDVTNIGDVAGSDIVQVYVSPTGSKNLFREEQVLAGYTKPHIPPGETNRVSIDLAENAFGVFDPAVGEWVRVKGGYELRVASSSRDFQEILDVEVDGADPESISVLAMDLPTYAAGDANAVPDMEFERLLGRAAPPTNWDKKEPLDRDSVLAQLPGHSTLASVVHGGIVGAANALDLIGKPIAANYARFTLAFPLRSLEVMSDGKVSEQTMDTVIAFLNGEGLKWLHAKK